MSRKGKQGLDFEIRLFHSHYFPLKTKEIKTKKGKDGLDLFTFCMFMGNN